MGDKSKISWTDASWNPTTGCSKVSEGCRNCYAAALAPRLAAMGQDGYTPLPWTKKNAPENVILHEDRLEKPLRWKRPRRVFVDSMSDLFHELVPFEFVAEVFAIMAASPRHTFQILTKRPERMAAWFEWIEGRWPELFPFGMPEDEPPDANVVLQFLRPELMGKIGADEFAAPWPLPNVWLGTSVEDQRAADERIPHLLGTPAAVRFLSCEPLIGPVDLAPWLGGFSERHGHAAGLREAGRRIDEAYLGRGHDSPRVHWVIAGGESGPNHRPLDHGWMRALRDRCEAAGVAFWAKQDSGPRPEVELPEDLRIRRFPEAAGVGA